jgi:hypothetical protein
LFLGLNEKLNDGEPTGTLWTQETAYSCLYPDG